MSNEIICKMEIKSNHSSEVDTVNAIRAMLTDGKYYIFNDVNYKLDGSIESINVSDEDGELIANIIFLVRGSLHSRMGDESRVIRQKETLPYNDVEVKYLSIEELMELLPTINHIEINAKNENYLFYEEIIASRGEHAVSYSETTGNLVDFICLDCLAYYVERLLNDNSISRIEDGSPQSIELMDFYQFHSTDEDAVCDNDKHHSNTIEGCWKPSMDVLDIMIFAVNMIIETYKSGDENIRKKMLDHDTLVQMLREEIIHM